MCISFYERLCHALLVIFSSSISLHYCIIYSAIQPLKAASVLNKISCQLAIHLAILIQLKLIVDNDFNPHLVFRQSISSKRNEVGIIVALEVE